MALFLALYICNSIINDKDNDNNDLSTEHNQDYPDDNSSVAEKQELQYTLNQDGNSYSVTGIGTYKDTTVRIPNTYNK